MEELIFGKLTLAALPHEWYTWGATISIALGGLGVAGILTYYKRWKWIWNEWLTSTDPKKIGIIYIIVAALMLFRVALDPVIIWAHQAFLAATPLGLRSTHFQEIC